jgi:four helix bundle protein
MPRNHEQLDVFHRSHKLTLEVYAVARRLPAEERYGLAGQLRRAASSVPTNIVEGCVRVGPRAYRNFLDIALGSAAETRYLLGLIVDLGYVTEGDVIDCRIRSDHVVRELQNLLKAVSKFER